MPGLIGYRATPRDEYVGVVERRGDPIKATPKCVHLSEQSCEWMRSMPLGCMVLLLPLTSSHLSPLAKCANGPETAACADVTQSTEQLRV